MTGNDQAAQLAASILRFRRFRETILTPDIFGEPAWELLLEVFVADAKGEAITGRIAAERRGISPAVISRWLKHLTVQGLLVGDGDGNVDDELTLSGIGMAKIETVLLEARILKDEFAQIEIR
ncbi:hypothetical protein [Sphingomonas faeni]|uniref:hypothetical protein n=1 Tax=Sphingomonas faeni TaxID=185950 RepID=UPI0033606945